MTATITLLSAILIAILVMSKNESIKINDKTYHVWCGILITIIGGLISYHFLDSRIRYAILIGFICGTSAAFLKEFVWDRAMKLGVFSWEDIKATMCGVLVGSVVLVMIFGTINHLGV